MDSRPRRRGPNCEAGFTLIELLVVMVILGVLASISMPILLKQRARAVDSAVKSDLRVIASEMEAYYTAEREYPPAAQSAGPGSDVTVGGAVVKVSGGSTFTAVALADADTASGAWPGAQGYCVTGANPRGGVAWVYNSLDRGLAQGSCP